MLKIIFFFFLLSFTLRANENFILDTPTGGNFSLETSLKKDFKLSDLKGKTVFIFFGYIKCPTVCPMTVGRLRKLGQYLEKNKVKDAHFLFISVDNERDDIKSLRKYAKTSGKLFSAGTSNEKNLRDILSMYGGYFSKIKNSSGHTIIDHSDYVYVINPNGKWVESIKYNSPYEDYLKAYEKSKINIVTLPSIPAKREMDMLGQNSSCDLGKGACSFYLADKSSAKVEFSPTPIKTEKEFSISVKINSKIYTPYELDFVGVEQNMGLIRPRLLKNDSENYNAKIDLPICELRKMKWRIRLVLKDEKSRLNFIEYFLETLE